MYCNESDFINANSGNQTWYTQNYPVLSSDFLNTLVNIANTNGTVFPSMAQLTAFYNNDCQLRNITPVQNLLSCYDSLFSYYLANVNPYVQGEAGQNFSYAYTEPTPIQNTINNLPVTVQKSIQDIGKGLNLSLTEVFWLLGILAVILILNFIRK